MERRWFDFDKLDVIGVDPIEPLQLPPVASVASSGWVGRRGGGCFGCCSSNARGACADCCGIGALFGEFSKPKLEIDEYGRLVRKPLCCGLDSLNIVGFALYAIILACAILLFYALTLILNQVAAEAGSGEGGADGGDLVGRV